MQLRELHRRIGRQKMLSVKTNRAYGLSLIQETHQKQLESIDKLTTEIKTCTVQMNRYHEPFAFLQIQTLLDAEKR